MQLLLQLNNCLFDGALVVPHRSTLPELFWHIAAKGKGLGVGNAGRSEIVKASLKFDKTGLGAGDSELHEFKWWDHAFNQASSNIIIDSDSDASLSMHSFLISNFGYR